MRRAVALFEREVWTGAFLPKWQRIVAEVAKRKRVRARRKGAKMEDAEEIGNDPAEEEAAHVAVAVAARPVAAAAAAPASAAALPPAMTLPPPQHPLVWDTSIRGRFTPASGRMLKQWFVDHIQVSGRRLLLHTLRTRMQMGRIAGCVPLCPLF